MTEENKRTHEWFQWQRPDGRELTCCKHCGMLRKADGSNDSKACRGPVKIGLRATED